MQKNLEDAIVVLDEVFSRYHRSEKFKDFFAEFLELKNMINDLNFIVAQEKLEDFIKKIFISDISTTFDAYEKIELQSVLKKIERLHNAENEEYSEEDEDEDYDENEEYLQTLKFLNETAGDFEYYSRFKYSEDKEDYEAELIDEIEYFRCTTSVKECLRALLELHERYIVLEVCWPGVDPDFDKIFKDSLTSMIKKSKVSEEDILLIMSDKIQKNLKNNEEIYCYEGHAHSYEDFINTLYFQILGSKLNQDVFDRFCKTYELDENLVKDSINDLKLETAQIAKKRGSFR